MDHLPRPSNPALPPIEITYDCSEPYDNESAIGYPKRHGWEVLYSPYGIRYLHNGEKPEPPKLRSFLQNWMYFGLLHELFGTDMDIQDFVTENENGVKVITTKPLNDAITKVCADLEPLKEFPEVVQDNAIHHPMSILEHTWRVSLNTILRYKKDIISEEFWVSLAALVEAIDIALYGVFLKGNTNNFRQVGNPSVGGFMIEGMRANGWCPFDVKRIDCTTGKVSMLYYLSNLPPPRAHLNHEKCTDDLCVWMSIGPEYNTKHLKPHCECEGFGDVGNAIEALQGGGIPLIQGEQGLDGQNMKFSIVDSATGVDFVAISHVWAEGLGNPHSNALPSCSLEWVQNMVDNLPGNPEGVSTPFWCDTLCVPISPPEMYTVAMNFLRHPYVNSSKVLVLDSYLYTKDSSKMSALEIWCSVIVCSWSQRLWTFQESRLAKDVYFQFADRAVHLGQVYYESNTNMAQEVLAQATILAYRGHVVIRSEEWNPKLTVRIMREALRGRAVSVASDEALCVFCNMFMDMELVTSLPPEDRMPMFWRQVKEVPIGIIFSTTTKKLTEPGLHWAPHSFMGELDTPHWLIEQWPPINGHYTPKGLIMPVGGFLMSQNLLIWDDSFDTIFSDTECPLRDEKGAWYWLELREPWNQSRTEFPGANEFLCILMHRTTQSEVADNDAFAFAPGVQGVIGTLSFDNPEEPPRFKGYRHVILHQHSPASQELHKSAYTFVERYVASVCLKQVRAQREALLENEENEPIEDDSVEASNGEGITLTENDDQVNLKEGHVLADISKTKKEAPSLEDDVSRLQISQEIASSSKNTASDVSGELIVGDKKDEDGQEEENQEDEDDEEEEENEEEEEEDEDDEVETPENFKLTDERRAQIQRMAIEFARVDETTRKLALAHGRVQNRDEEAALEQYGFHCRFQLQMRLRNGMTSVPKDALWFID